MMKQTVWPAGAKGLVGRELIKKLAPHPAHETVIAQRGQALRNAERVAHRAS